MPVRAPRTASRPAACRSRSAWPSPPASNTPRSRCSVETNSSASRRASSAARSSTRRARASSVSWPPAIFPRHARGAASPPRNAPRSTPSLRSVWAGIPSSASTRAARMCSASRTGLWSRSASACAPAIASWAFWVKRSRFMARSDPSGRGVSGRRRHPRTAGSFGGPRVGLVRRVQEGGGGLPSRLVEHGQDHSDLDVEVAAAVALEARHPLAAQPDHAPVLGAGGDAEQDPAGQRPDGNLGAQERFAEGHRQLPGERRAVAVKDRMRRDLGDEHEIARARALAAAAAKANPAPGLDAGRDLHLQPLPVHLHEPGRPAKGIVQAHVDVRLHGGRRRHVAARMRPATRRGAPGASGRLVCLARHVAREEGPEEVGEIAAVAGELEPDASISGAATHAGPSARPWSAARAGRRPETGEGPARAERVAARPGARPGVVLPVDPQLVVLRPLGGVGKDLVRLVDLLEAALGVLVSRVPVRVVVPRELPVCLLDLRRRGGLGDAQDGVVVLVLHEGPPSAALETGARLGRGQRPDAIAGGWSAGKPGRAGTARGSLCFPPPEPGDRGWSGCGRRRKAASSTWSIESTRMTLICFRISSGMSRRSFSFFFGRTTRRAPERCAARILLLRPPIGRTRPRSVISPVIARSLRTGMPVSALTIAVAVGIPADGPSLGIAPAGTCLWIGSFAKTSRSIPCSGSLAWIQGWAARADSFR